MSGVRPASSRVVVLFRPGRSPSPGSRRSPRCASGTTRAWMRSWPKRSKNLRMILDLPPRNATRVPKLRQCLAALSREHREVIDLVYYHEKSIEEVAQIIGIPENTVKTRMFYARKKLGELCRSAGIDRGWP